jgi:hypothetical protein
MHFYYLAIAVIWATPSWSKLSLFTADDLPPLSSDCVAAMTADLDCAAMEFGGTINSKSHASDSDSVVFHGINPVGLV